jgi:hypothetical protein
MVEVEFHLARAVSWKAHIHISAKGAEISSDVNWLPSNADHRNTSVAMREHIAKYQAVGERPRPVFEVHAGFMEHVIDKVCYIEVGSLSR